MSSRNRKADDSWGTESEGVLTHTPQQKPCQVRVQFQGLELSWSQISPSPGQLSKMHMDSLEVQHRKAPTSVPAFYLSTVSLATKSLLLLTATSVRTLHTLDSSVHWFRRGRTCSTSLLSQSGSENGQGAEPTCLLRNSMRRSARGLTPLPLMACTARAVCHPGSVGGMTQSWGPGCWPKIWRTSYGHTFRVCDRWRVRLSSTNLLFTHTHTYAHARTHTHRHACSLMTNQTAVKKRGGVYWVEKSLLSW